MALKIAAANLSRAPYVQIAAELAMSPSEVCVSVKRGQFARLLHGPELDNRPNLTALEEFLVHGLRYAFPAERGEYTRGIPTSYAAEPLRSRITEGDEPIPVWPHASGKQRGIGLKPLYRSAPHAALLDAGFYEYLALADALRDGRTRERKYAEEELHSRFRRASARPKS